jgi:methylated-DNA-[protein]-cysteine S-methyltransferase
LFKIKPFGKIRAGLSCFRENFSLKSGREIMKDEAVFLTDWGVVRAAWNEGGIGFLSLPDRNAPFDGEHLTEKAQEIKNILEEYFQGKRTTFPFQIDLTSCTPFQKRVLKVVESIPYGEVRSYRWVAEQTGCPKGARAVGQAVGANPVGIFIP